MYVCLCMGVTDRKIDAAISEGASSVEQVMYCTGAGTRCGGCIPTISAMLDADDEVPSCRRLPVLRAASSAA